MFAFKSQRFFSFISLSAFTAFTSLFAASDPKWSNEVVARSANGNRQIAIIRPPDGKLRLAYTGCSDSGCVNDELFYSVQGTDGKWASVSLDAENNFTGRYPSMTLTSDNVLHVFYTNYYGLPILRHAFKSMTNETALAEGWKKEIIGKKTGGMWTSAASLGNQIFVGNTSFPTSNIDVSVMEVASITPTATETTPPWAFEEVDTSWSSGWFSNIAIAPNGQPVTAFTQGKFPDGDLFFSQRLPSGKWEQTMIDYTAYKSSMALDKKGFVHLAYTRSDEKYMSTRDLYYATNAPDGDWHLTKVEGGEYKEQDTGLFPNLKIDPKGGIHILYKDSLHQKVMYARNLGQGWKIYPVTRNKQDGNYPSMEIDKNGGIHAAYDAGYEIHYIYCKDCALH